MPSSVKPQNRRLTPKRFTLIIAAFRDDNQSSLLTDGEGFENKALIRTLIF